MPGISAIDLTKVDEDKGFSEDISPKSVNGENEDEELKLLHAEIRPTAERRLVRKLDFKLLPLVVLIFVMNYIDRTAVTTARLNGLEKDLGLTDIQYETVVAILYVSYCPAQIPSNMILNRITRPSLYIGICVVLWGLTSALSGITHNYAGMIACRVFIGLPETAFYPGIIYLLSRWYTRKELASRSAIFYSGTLIANAFGSLMAAGILSGMNGARGISAWRWLFYIEGSITVAIGFLTIWLLPDYPTTTRRLTSAERRLAQVRVAEDAAEADEDRSGDSAFSGLLMALKDVKVLIFAVMTFSQLLGLSFVNFFPTLTATLGFDTTITLLLAAPPWIVACVICWGNAIHADRSGERYLHLTIPWWCTVIGYIIGMSTFSVAGRYVALFLMAGGYAGSALTLVWVCNAVPRPPAKRAAAIGIVNACGILGFLAGSYVWKAEWGPEYHQSMGVSLAALVFCIALATVIRAILIRDNKRLAQDELRSLKGADLERVKEAARLEGISLEKALEQRKGFRYLY